MSEAPVVLIVDDDPKFAAMLRRMVSQAGYTTIVSEDVIHALELMNFSPPDVVLLDLLMPDLDGESFANYFLSGGATTVKTRFIMMSAHDDGRDAAIRAHASAFLHKPFHVVDAVGAIERALCSRMAALPAPKPCAPLDE